MKSKAKLIDLIPGHIKKLSSKRKKILKKSAIPLGIEIGGGYTESLIHTSSIDPRFKVEVVFKKHKEYKSIHEPIFEQVGIAYIPQKQRNIIVDGEETKKKYFTKDHLLAIEAHEISHDILKHKRCYIGEEIEADLCGIFLLENKKYFKAAKLLSNRFEEQYEMKSSEVPLSKKSGKLLIKYLKNDG